MWYKRSGAWGIREKGGAQLFQVKSYGTGRVATGHFADDCIALLEGGTAPPDVMALVAKQKAHNKETLDTDAAEAVAVESDVHSADAADAESEAGYAKSDLLWASDSGRDID